MPSRVKRRFAEGRSCGGSKTTVPLLPCFIWISRLNSCWIWCCKKWLFHNQVDGMLKLHSKSENKSSVNKFLKTKKNIEEPRHFKVGYGRLLSSFASSCSRPIYQALPAKPGSLQWDYTQLHQVLQVSTTAQSESVCLETLLPPAHFSLSITQILH